MLTPTLDRLMARATARYDWEATLPCTRVLQGANQTTEVTYLDPKNGRPTMIEPWTPLWYYGLGIQIRLQSTDGQPTPTETGSGPSNKPSGGSQEEEEEGGLTPGAAAGIAIGATLLVLLMIGGGIWACLMKRKARKRQQPPPASPPPPSYSPHEVNGEGLPAPAVYKTEIAGHQRPAELYPLHHEAAYGSQVHLAPQELAQPTGDHAMHHTWSPLPTAQAYEMSPHPHPHPHPLTPPTPVYYELEQQRRWL